MGNKRKSDKKHLRESNKKSGYSYIYFFCSTGIYWITFQIENYYLIFVAQKQKYGYKQYQQIQFRLQLMENINAEMIEILLAAILVSNTYNKDQAVIKWGGIVIAVAGVASVLIG